MTGDATRRTPRTGPAAYTLRVSGRLDEHWSAWFAPLEIAAEQDGTTELTGVVADQAELHGLLAKIRDLGVTLLSVTADASTRPPPARGADRTQ